jgi:hypothetical protein
MRSAVETEQFLSASARPEERLNEISFGAGDGFERSPINRHGFYTRLLDPAASPQSLHPFFSVRPGA